MSDLERFNESRPFSYRDVPNRRPRYNDDSDYTTNAPSYYDDLARKTALMKRLSLRVWEYQELINKQFDEWDEELRKRFLAWDKNLEEFDDEVLKLLQEWMLDGTLDHIINETIFSWKVDQDDFDELVKEVERIDEVKTEQSDFELLEKEVKQPSFTDILKEYVHYDKIVIRSMYSSTPHVGQLFIDLISDDKQLIHSFVPNNDDYYMHTRTFANDSVNYDSQPIKMLPSNNTTFDNFTLIPTDEMHGYTTNVGSGFSVTFTTDEVDTQFYARLFTDNRGGVWRFTHQSTNEKVDISTWNDTNILKTLEIFDNLPTGKQTIKAEFLGDDPKNPPSDGTARGWLSSKNQQWFRINKELTTLDMNNDNLIKDASNIEFAFNFKPNIESEYYMVPFHGEPTAFKRNEIQILDGDKEIDIFSTTVHEIENELIIRQNVYGRHPSTPDVNQMTIQTDHIFGLDGSIKVNGKLKTLRDTYFNNSYTVMGVAKSDIFNNILSSFDNSYPNTSDQWLSSNKITYLEEETDRATSYCFLSGSNRNLAIAFNFLNPKQTLRQNKEGKNIPGQMTYIQHRNEDIVKIYHRLFNSQDNLIPANNSYTWSGEYVFANQKDISILFKGV